MTEEREIDNKEISRKRLINNVKTSVVKYYKNNKLSALKKLLDVKQKIN